jgi:hypothetical protein
MTLLHGGVFRHPNPDAKQRVPLLRGEQIRQGGVNRPISVYRLGEMPTQSCGQSVSAPRGKAGVRLNAHTELRAERQRLAREVMYRSWPIDEWECERERDCERKWKDCITKNIRARSGTESLVMSQG